MSARDDYPIIASYVGTGGNLGLEARNALAEIDQARAVVNRVRVNSATVDQLRWTQDLPDGVL